MLYSVVINNPNDEDDAQVVAAHEKGWQIHGQMEKGKNGTPHYQLAVEAPVPWKAMKRHFTRANIEEAKDPEALLKYVAKTETRTRSLDFTNHGKPVTVSDKLSLPVFWSEVFYSLHDCYGDLSEERLRRDAGVDLLNQATALLVREHGSTFARFAVRPDVKATWRHFRTALYAHWRRENDSLLVGENSGESINGDDEVPRQEDTDDEQSITIECTDNQEASDEEESSEGEGDTSTEGSCSEDD